LEISRAASFVPLWTPPTLTHLTPQFVPFSLSALSWCSCSVWLILLAWLIDAGVLEGWSQAYCNSSCYLAHQASCYPPT
jgi:hypothetical protein